MKQVLLTLFLLWTIVDSAPYEDVLQSINKIRADNHLIEIAVDLEITSKTATKVHELKPLKSKFKNNTISEHRARVMYDGLSKTDEAYKDLHYNPHLGSFGFKLQGNPLKVLLLLQSFDTWAIKEANRIRGKGLNLQLQEAARIEAQILADLQMQETETIIHNLKFQVNFAEIITNVKIGENFSDRRYALLQAVSPRRITKITEVVNKSSVEQIGFGCKTTKRTTTQVYYWVVVVHQDFYFPALQRILVHRKDLAFGNPQTVAVFGQMDSTKMANFTEYFCLFEPKEHIKPNSVSRTDAILNLANTITSSSTFSKLDQVFFECNVANDVPTVRILFAVKYFEAFLYLISERNDPFKLNLGQPEVPVADNYSIELSNSVSLAHANTEEEALSLAVRSFLKETKSFAQLVDSQQEYVKMNCTKGDKEWTAGIILTPKHWAVLKAIDQCQNSKMATRICPQMYQLIEKHGSVSKNDVGFLENPEYECCYKKIVLKDYDTLDTELKIYNAVKRNILEITFGINEPYKYAFMLPVTQNKLNVVLFKGNIYENHSWEINKKRIKDNALMHDQALTNYLLTLELNQKLFLPKNSTTRIESDGQIVLYNYIPKVNAKTDEDAMTLLIKHFLGIVSEPGYPVLLDSNMRYIGMHCFDTTYNYSRFKVPMICISPYFATTIDLLRQQPGLDKIRPHPYMLDFKSPASSETDPCFQQYSTVVVGFSTLVNALRVGVEQITSDVLKARQSPVLRKSATSYSEYEYIAQNFTHVAISSSVSGKTCAVILTFFKYYDTLEGLFGRSAIPSIKLNQEAAKFAKWDLEYNLRKSHQIVGRSSTQGVIPISLYVRSVDLRLKGLEVNKVEAVKFAAREMNLRDMCFGQLGVAVETDQEKNNEIVFQVIFLSLAYFEEPLQKINTVRKATEYKPLKLDKNMMNEANDHAIKMVEDPKAQKTTKHSMISCIVSFGRLNFVGTSLAAVNFCVERSLKGNSGETDRKLDSKDMSRLGIACQMNPGKEMFYIVLLIDGTIPRAQYSSDLSYAAQLGLTEYF